MIRHSYDPHPVQTLYAEKRVKVSVATNQSINHLFIVDANLHENV